MPDESSLPTPTIDDIYRIVNEILDKRLSGEQIPFQLVPEPDSIKNSTPGRRTQRKYERISITIDSELWKLFKNQQKQLNCSSPRLMDSILYYHFSKPPLSYNQEGNDDE